MSYRLIFFLNFMAAIVGQCVGHESNEKRKAINFFDERIKKKRQQCRPSGQKKNDRIDDVDDDDDDDEAFFVID